MVFLVHILLEWLCLCLCLRVYVRHKGTGLGQWRRHHWGSIKVSSHVFSWLSRGLLFTRKRAPHPCMLQHVRVRVCRPSYSWCMEQTPVPLMPMVEPLMSTHGGYTYDPDLGSSMPCHLAPQLVDIMLRWADFAFPSEVMTCDVENPGSNPVCFCIRQTYKWRTNYSNGQSPDVFVHYPLRSISYM